VAFTEPYLFDLPYSFTASVQDSAKEFNAYRGGKPTEYREFARSFGFAVGTRLATFLPGPAWAFFTRYQAGYTLRAQRMEGAGNSYFRDTGTQVSSTVNQFLTYDTVDHPFKPTTGLKGTLGFEYGGWQLGGDQPFHRTTLEGVAWTNLAGRHIFGAKVAYGYVKNLTKAELPIWELYRLGGENSVRGYEFGQVGTADRDPNGDRVVVGGNKQFVANLEYQLKLTEPLRVVAFFDAGNAWAPGAKLFSESLRRSAGVELRVFLPISPMPLRFIWARKLNPYAHDPAPRSNFQFSFGTTF